MARYLDKKSELKNGFTLIELMIVVAIIGILAAIAIPQYQDYIARSQTQRLVAEVSNRKVVVEEFMVNSFYGFNEIDLGWSASNLSDTADPATPTAGDGLQVIAFAVSADGYGYLMTTAGGVASSNITGLNVFIEREQTGSWSCQIEKASASLWKDSYLPPNCTLLADGAAPIDN